MHKIELDIVLLEGETPAMAAATLVKGLDVESSVLHEVGPGGGNPVILFKTNDGRGLHEVIKRVTDDADLRFDLSEMIECVDH